MSPTLLIVDDHPSFRLTARALLEAEGFEVVGEAEDGMSAIEGGATAQARGCPARRAAARHRRFRGGPTAHRERELADVVLTSSRDGSDFGPLVERSGARGFVPKAELSGAALNDLLE